MVNYCCESVYCPSGYICCPMYNDTVLCALNNYYCCSSSLFCGSQQNCVNPPTSMPTISFAPTTFSSGAPSSSPSVSPSFSPSVSPSFSPSVRTTTGPSANSSAVGLLSILFVVRSVKFLYALFTQSGEDVRSRKLDINVSVRGMKNDLDTENTIALTSVNPSNSGESDVDRAMALVAEQIKASTKSYYSWFFDISATAKTYEIIDYILNVVSFSLVISSLNALCENDPCEGLAITSYVLVFISFMLKQNYYCAKEPTYQLKIYKPAVYVETKRGGPLTRTFVEWPIDGKIVKVYHNPNYNKKKYATIKGVDMSEFEVGKGFEKVKGQYGLKEYKCEPIDWDERLKAFNRDESQLAQYNLECRQRVERMNAVQLFQVNAENAQIKLEHEKKLQEYYNNVEKYKANMIRASGVVTGLQFIMVIVSLAVIAGCDSSGLCKIACSFTPSIQFAVSFAIHLEVMNELKLSAGLEVVKHVGGDKYTADELGIKPS